MRSAAQACRGNFRKLHGTADFPLAPRRAPSYRPHTRRRRRASRTSRWGHSSVGRALEWHSRGQGFDSPWLHQTSFVIIFHVVTGCLSHMGFLPVGAIWFYFFFLYWWSGELPARHRGAYPTIVGDPNESVSRDSHLRESPHTVILQSQVILFPLGQCSFRLLTLILDPEYSLTRQTMSTGNLGYCRSPLQSITHSIKHLAIIGRLTT